MRALFELNYNEKETDAVLEVLSSKWITMGPKVKQFEADFSKYIGRSEGVAVNSCTAALHLAMRLIDARPGDEIIVPSLTFVATANAVRYVGAVPVFADVSNLNDWTISPQDVEKKITPKTKAVIVMHYGGFSCDMEAIMRLAKAHGLFVIEDAAHAPGSTWKGRKVGTTGDIACYSFYTNKNVSTAEGGMLLTDDSRWADRARELRNHGMTSSAIDRKNTSKMYEVVDLGYNYRLDDIRAALGIVQLQKLDQDIKKRNELAKRYHEKLENSHQLEIPFQGYDGISNYHSFPTRLKEGSRDDFMSALLSKGVQTNYHYPPIHLFRSYEEYTTSLPLTEKIGSSCVNLPIHSLMDVDDVDVISDAINKMEVCAI